MKRNIFAVCDLEVDYALNFMDYMNRKKNIPFEIQAFTSVIVGQLCIIQGPPHSKLAERIGNTLFLAPCIFTEPQRRRFPVTVICDISPLPFQPTISCFALSVYERKQ